MSPHDRRCSVFVPVVPVVLVVLIVLAQRCQCQEGADENNFNPLSVSTMHLIIDYAIWRRLDHVIIFDSYLQRGHIPNNVMQLIDCMGKQGIYSSIYSTHVQATRDIFRINRHRLGVVVLIRYNETIDQGHILMKASSQKLFDEQHAWLLITISSEDSVAMINRLKQISLGLTSDIVLAKAVRRDSVDLSVGSTNSTCPILLPPRTINTDTFSQGVFVFRQPSPSNRSKRSVLNDKMMSSIHKVDGTFGNNKYLNGFMFEKPMFELVQVYMIRRDDVKSMVFIDLGSWGTHTTFDKVKPFVPVEGRQDLMGFPIVVGFKNWTATLDPTNYQGGTKKQLDTDVDDTENLQEIMSFIAKSLNASIKYKPYLSVGTEIQDGVWSDMLNAVVSGEVDFGLEKVTVSYHKLDYMAFTHNIMKMSHNIYMHPSDQSVSKDIYLTPFSPKLLLCVLAMAILLALVMLIASAVANYRAKKKQMEVEPVNASYAALWIVGILSMQGSLWTPISSSGNMTLMSSLMFALIIYNSYAAFITSILSVKTSDINSLDDLFENGYKVGYIQNSQDENYLQKQKNELENIYLRGYSSKVNDIEEGLLKAARTKYALFVSTQAARRTLQVLSPYECRCQIQEFVLRSTIEEVAFPLSKSSPFHKVINLGVMRLKESGTLSRIQADMMPGMPRCNAESSFVSAQLEDVFTAVLLLLAGIILSIVIAIGECVFRYRKELRKNLKFKAQNFGSKVKETVQNFEF